MYKFIKQSLFLFTLLISFNSFAENKKPALKVFTVKSSVARHDVILEANIIEVTYNKASMPNGIITNKDEIIGKQALRNIRPGTNIRDSFIRVKPDVVKNKEVKITYNMPGITLEATGLALEDGLVGDSIKILNQQSKKTILAKVIAQNVVSVKK